jgi:sister-chromatid-cohesion protein PDS5
MAYTQGGIIDENEEAITQRLNAVLQRLSGQSSLLLLPIYFTITGYTIVTFPDTQRAADDLNSFAKANEGRLYKLFKACIDPQTDLKGLIKATVGFSNFLQSKAHQSMINLYFSRTSSTGAWSNRHLQFCLR